ncbi:MAG: SpoIVB peptidase [Clostridia bacterium]|nr:SpoIVB peptidase [Clostridia bacterium]
MKYKGLKRFGVLLCILLTACNLSKPMRLVAALPSDIYVTEGDMPSLSLGMERPFSLSAQAAPVGASTAERLNDAVQTMRVKLFDVLTVKRIHVHQRERIMLMPGGQSIGVALYMPGALVVGMTSFTAINGKPTSPAQTAGLKAGDIILSVNGDAVKNAAHLSQLCAHGGDTLLLTIQREDTRLDVQVRPAQAADDGLYKLGIWVRDSTAGIGTISFYDTLTLRYGALGHPVTDVDTGSLLQIGNGEISQARVIGISYGLQGTPGELHGAFGGAGEKIGALRTNTEYGIFGELYAPLSHPLYPNGVPLAYANEVKTGDAVILSTVDEAGVQAFACRINKCFPQEKASGKGMIVEITDERLLSTTGGIVQGMSGSPVMQNGKLAGIVTHVFVNDPSRGYCVYAEWMYEAAMSQ